VVTSSRSSMSKAENISRVRRRFCQETKMILEVVGG
jgi:hypothetical protein